MLLTYQHTMLNASMYTAAYFPTCRVIYAAGSAALAYVNKFQKRCIGRSEVELPAHILAFLHLLSSAHRSPSQNVGSRPALITIWITANGEQTGNSVRSHCYDLTLMISSPTRTSTWSLSAIQVLRIQQRAHYGADLYTECGTVVKYDLPNF